MKAFLRHPRVQAFLGWILGSYFQLIRRTTRWQHEGLEGVRPILASQQGALTLLWHGRIPIWMGMGEVWLAREKRGCLVSPSADGEFLAMALARAGYPSIRMSSAKKGDAAKARAAVAGFREAMNLVNDGGVLLVTPDGPRGPNEVIAPGALQIAKRTGAPVFLTGLAVSPAMRLEDQWDRAMIGWPFGRGAVVWDGPHYVAADADEVAIAGLISDWSQRLSTATRRAEALVGSQGRTA